MKFKPFTVGAVLMHKHERIYGMSNKEKPKKKWFGSKPEKCDLCDKEFDEIFIDGKTQMGPWGLLCGVCHYMYGVGLGTGRGQKYDLKTLEKIDG